MKKFNYLLICVLAFGCSRFSEDINMTPLPDSFSELDTELPIVNIRVKQKKFDKMFEQYEEEIEIDAEFDLYRNQVLVVDDEDVELEIKGNYSTRYTLKSIGVKFEDKYNNTDRSLINPEKVLPFHKVDKIKAIRLRNSGNDFPKTMLKDLSYTQLAINAELDLDLTYGEPALVYINEEFYGLMNIRTEANTNGMASLYGVDKDDITLAKVTTHVLYKKDGDEQRIDDFVSATERRDLNYIKSEIEIDNFIDYMVFQSYTGNTDWPHNNCRFYAIGNAPFRFVLFDLDNVANLKINKLPITLIEGKRVPNIITDLFFVLYEDITFKDAFWNRFKFLVERGTVSPDQLQNIVYKNASAIESEIKFQIQEHSSPRSFIEWELELDKLLVLFEERAEMVRLDLENR